MESIEQHFLSGVVFFLCCASNERASIHQVAKSEFKLCGSGPGCEETLPGRRALAHTLLDILSLWAVRYNVIGP